MTRRSSPTLSAAALATLGLAAACAESDAPASASQGADRQCFHAGQVNGFSAVDDDTVHVHVGANDVYELELFGPCQDVDWSERIGIRATGGSDWICRGIDAELIVPGPIGPDQCQVSSLRKLSDDEIRARRDRDRD